MDDNFWESLRLGFMQLREECAIDPPLSPAGRLIAIWTTPSRWELDYHKGNDGSGVIKRFGWAAENAAATLGFLGPEGQGLAYWLDQIKGDAPASHLQGMSVLNGAGEMEVYSVTVLDICGLSADYCRKCHADEIRRRNSLIASQLSSKPGSSVLPALDSDATARLADVLSEARGHVLSSGSAGKINDAMLLYLDSIAWEYVLTQSVQAVKLIIDEIGSKAYAQFAGDPTALTDRKQYWVKESCEREVNGIVGSAIPIRTRREQAPVFADLEDHFAKMVRDKGELSAIIHPCARFGIWGTASNATDDELHRMDFDHLARQAMAVLDLRFSDPSRAVFYWLQLLKQESPLWKNWNTQTLCLASQKFCSELKTRAQESKIREMEAPVWQLPAPAQVIFAGSVPSKQSFGASPPQQISPGFAPSRRSVDGGPVIHSEVFFLLRRHSIVPGANGPTQSLCDKIRDEIIQIADRIQAVENPELPASEAGDRWLDRLSLESRPVWDLHDVLDQSARFCRAHATHLIRSAKSELAVHFDGFANRFDVLRAPLLGDEKTVAQNTSNEKRKLNTKMISDWLRKQGYRNEDLAEELGVSSRTISSLRNGGSLHGREVITKLANLMEVESDDLFFK